MALLLEAQEPVLTGGTYTPEDLLKMPEENHFELLDGNLVERKMGAKASQVASNVLFVISMFVRANQLGKVFDSECGYQIFADRPNRVRRADCSFIARGRLPEDKTPDGYIRIAPDLAVEVVSPNDLAEEVEKKRLDYLEAGVGQVWILYPLSRTVHVHRRDGGCTVLKSEGTLTGVDVLPGFSTPVAAFFEGID